jgi:hypothetical protein
MVLAHMSLRSIRQQVLPRPQARPLACMRAPASSTSFHWVSTSALLLHLAWLAEWWGAHRCGRLVLVMELDMDDDASRSMPMVSQGVTRTINLSGVFAYCKPTTLPPVVPVCDTEHVTAYGWFEEVLQHDDVTWKPWLQICRCVSATRIPNAGHGRHCLHAISWKMCIWPLPGYHDQYRIWSCQLKLLLCWNVLLILREEIYWIYDGDWRGTWNLRRVLLKLKRIRIWSG